MALHHLTSFTLGSRWGVCTECGMGRAGREEIPVLLDLHRKIVAAG